MTLLAAVDDAGEKVEGPVQNGPIVHVLRVREEIRRGC
jgi:hypothetical protein